MQALPGRFRNPGVASRREEDHGVRGRRLHGARGSSAYGDAAAPRLPRLGADAAHGLEQLGRVRHHDHRSSRSKAQADYMAEQLLPFGWQTSLTVDIQWYEPDAKGHGYRTDAALDDGRVSAACCPRPTAFPPRRTAAASSRSRDYVHAKGLQFGIHLMRGIPRLAVAQNLPVEGHERARARHRRSQTASARGTPTCTASTWRSPARRPTTTPCSQLIAVVGRRLREGRRHQPALPRARSGDRGHPPRHRPHGPADGAEPVARRDGAHRGRAREAPRQPVAHQRRLLGHLAGAARAVRAPGALERAPRGRAHWPDADMLPLGVLETGPSQRHASRRTSSAR